MSGKFKSYAEVGAVYGEWTVKSSKHVIKYGRAYWWCECSCGKTKWVEASKLITGKSMSCGCKRNVAHGGTYDDAYSCWESMKQRCLNPNNKSYHNYGGRGITIYLPWLKYENFKKDMGLRPEGTTLDRINNDLGYFPANCRWATPQEQSLNKRTNHRLSFNGDSLTIKEWSDKLGIPVTTIAKRIISGFTIEEVLSQTRLSNREEDYANKPIMYLGKTKTLKEWVDILGLKYNTIKSRLLRGVTDLDKLFSSKKFTPGTKPGSKKPEGSGRGMSVSPGDKFGKLTIKSLFREKSGKHTITKAICICDCGNEKIYSLSNIKSGKTVTCGCSKKQPHNKGVYSVYVGQRFSRLTITELYSENNISFATCQCDCGTTKRVAISNLKRGNTVSCGCKNRDKGKLSVVDSETL
jgi:hypothetical protein